MAHGAACTAVVNRFLMAIMNRLSPLIVRRAEPARRFVSNRSGQARATAISLAQPGPFAGADAGAWLEDLKLFATGWIGGLIFFGTLLS